MGIMPLQVVSLGLLARLAVACPNVVPASTLLRMTDSALDGLEAREAAARPALVYIIFAVSAFRCGPVRQQLDTDPVIGLAIRGLQCGGEEPPCLPGCIPSFVYWTYTDHAFPVCFHCITRGIVTGTSTWRYVSPHLQPLMDVCGGNDRAHCRGTPT
jgi:hypothetical protein